MIRQTTSSCDASTHSIPPFFLFNSRTCTIDGKSRLRLCRSHRMDTFSVFSVFHTVESLAFILANIGYDVWLGNMRGNRYSRAHVKYNPNHDEAFWDFSWDEMTSIDLPSMVYNILNERRLPLPNWEVTIISFRITLVSTRPSLELVIKKLLFGGPDTKNLNVSHLPVYAAHGPSGTSVKNMVHFMQCGRSDRFQAYDYGSPEKNHAHYNDTIPPIYSLRSMTIPSAIFWTGEDWLADPIDVTYVLDNLANLVYEKYLPHYNHFDFVWAKTAYELIYQDLIDVMQISHPIE